MKEILRRKNMSDVYEEILNASNIQNILEYYGLKVTKNKCNCPFHSDSHPSMSIHPSKGIAKCFSCGAGGNTISFIQKYENEINHNSIDVKGAMQKAIDIQGLDIKIPNNQYEPLTEGQKEQQRLSSILKDAITITENNLKMNKAECSKIREYLKNRNLSNDIIQNFHIGYDFEKNNILDELLKKYNINDLIKLGIAKEYNNWVSDVFKSRITIPIFDDVGNPVGFGARTMDNSIKPKYLNTKASDLFNKSKLLFNYHKAKSYARNDEIIIVEGYMDVISAKEMKMDNVVGIMGTALTKEHIDLIKKLRCEVTLCLDNDSAGKEAMTRIIPELLKEKLKVNVLDISKLGNFKDFGDLQIANMKRENIYQTKISAFTFLMQYKYIVDNELNVENIYNIYKKMLKDGLIKDTKDRFNFKEYISKNTNYTDEEIENIINPKEITTNNIIDKYKDVFFYSYIKKLIISYGEKHQDRVLIKYVESGKLESNEVLETLDNDKFLADEELTINIGDYIRDYILKSEKYIEFKNNKIFILDNLLNNVKSFDSKGNIVDIELTIKQKELIIKQYNESFDGDIKEYIENNPDEFEEIFIANSNSQFEKLFPKTYVETFKEQAMKRFKDDGVMEAVRYGLAYPEDMKNAMSRQFVNNDKFKTLLVFNNKKNILELTQDNIKEITTEKEYEKNKDKTIVKTEKTKEKNDMSIFITLSGKEKESYKGMYLPINEGTQIFIPKQLYRKNDKKIEILNSQSNQAVMSEYEVNNIDHTKKWVSKLSLDDFFHKYFNIYEIQKEKEVMA